MESKLPVTIRLSEEQPNSPLGVVTRSHEVTPRHSLRKQRIPPPHCTHSTEVSQGWASERVWGSPEGVPEALQFKGRFLPRTLWGLGHKPVSAALELSIH